MKFYLSLVLLLAPLLSFSAGRPAKNYSPASGKKYLRENPVWIQCIDSPHASYRYALYAFETFWQGRPRPMGENGEMRDTYEAIKDRKLTPEEEKYFSYVYEYKRFLEWKHRVIYLLDNEGRIYTDEQMKEHYRIRMEANR